jgi:putative iron-regulated protein
MVERVNPALANKIEQDILNCMNLIQAIRPANGGDFGQAIFTPDGRARTEKAVAALQNLKETFETQVLPIVDKQ